MSATLDLLYYYRINLDFFPDDLQSSRTFLSFSKPKGLVTRKIGLTSFVDSSFVAC